jgi:predicted MFS family arabinose efflux permease
LAHRAVSILLIVFAVNYMDRQLLAIFAEPIKRDLGLSDTQVAVLYGVSFALFYAFIGLPIARLADRGNRARIITWSLVLFSAMTGLCGLAGNYWHLLLARIGVGIGESGTGPASHSLIADLYPPGRRSTAMAFFSLGPHLGIVLAFLIGGSLAEIFGWRHVFLIAASAGIALAAAAKLMLKEPSRTSGSEVVAPWEACRELWRQRSLRHLIAGAAVITAADYALLGWLPTYLIRSHGLTLGETGTVLALVVGVGGGIGVVLSGLIADHLGGRDDAWRLRVVAVAWVISAPLWLIVFTQQSVVLMYSALVLAGSMIAFHMGPTFATVQSLVAPNARAFAASLLLLIANLTGLGLGPVIVGMLSDAGHSRFGAESLRVALLIVPPLYAWSAYHYYAATRTLARDLHVPSMGMELKMPKRQRAHFR